MDATHIVALLRGGVPERASAYTALEEGSQAGSVDAALAVGSLAPLAELLRLPVAQIDTREFQRICLVVANLCATDTSAIGWWMREAVTAPFSCGNAYAIILSKPLDEMTRMDVLTAAAAESTLCYATAAPGFDAALEAAGLDGAVFFSTFLGAHPLRTWEGDALGIRFATLAFEVLADSATKWTPAHRVGMHWALCHAGATRPGVCSHVIDSGLLDIFMAEIAKPSEAIECAPGTTTANSYLLSSFGMFYPTTDENRYRLISAMPGLFDGLLNILRAYEAMETLDRLHIGHLYASVLMLSDLLDFFPPSDGKFTHIPWRSWRYSRSGMV